MITHFFKATKYAIKGLTTMLKSELPFQCEVASLVVFIPLAFYIGHTALERAVLLSSLFLVLIVEALNSAVESTVDRIGTEHHVLSGQAKDIAAAAVFLSLVNVIVVWVIIFIG